MTSMTIPGMIFFQITTFWGVAIERICLSFWSEWMQKNAVKRTLSEYSEWKMLSDPAKVAKFWCCHLWFFATFSMPGQYTVNKRHLRMTQYGTCTVTFIWECVTDFAFMYVWFSWMMMMGTRKKTQKYYLIYKNIYTYICVSSTIGPGVWVFDQVRKDLRFQLPTSARKPVSTCGSSEIEPVLSSLLQKICFGFFVF